MTNPIFTLQTQQFLQSVLSLYAYYNLDQHGLFWRVDRGEFQLFVMCNDLFYWACSDLEPLVPENVHLLQSSAKDLQANNILSSGNLAVLFSCRSRDLQPQGAFFRDSPPALNTLLLQIGEERKVDKNPFGNTQKPGDIKTVSLTHADKDPLPQLPIENWEILQDALEFFAFEDCDTLLFKAENQKTVPYLDGEDIFGAGTDYSTKLTTETMNRLKDIKTQHKHLDAFFVAEMLFCELYNKPFGDYLKKELAQED